MLRNEFGYFGILTISVLFFAALDPKAEKQISYILSAAKVLLQPCLLVEKGPKGRPKIVRVYEAHNL